MQDPAYKLCKIINGGCSCEDRGANPCDAILDLVENEITAEEEADRILGGGDDEWEFY